MEEAIFFGTTVKQ